ncbi:MAG: DUF5777 family beta-barrel protein [Ferruginibacter sp.]
MKRIINNIKRQLALAVPLIMFLCLIGSTGYAQDKGKAKQKKGMFARLFNNEPPKVKPVKNMFPSVWIADNQTPTVPVKGTLEVDIQHRFGVINNGYSSDFYGFFAPSNIRLGVNYAPIKNLFVGVGITKYNMTVDGNLKYAIIQQTKGKYPVSVSYYGNMGVDTRKDKDGSLFKYSTQRLSYFNQLIIGRKVTDRFSIMVAPSISHQNSVTGYYTKNDSTGQDIFRDMKNNHFAIAVAVRYRITEKTSVMINYDQPLTKHNTNNPDPNLAIGIEMNTSSHSFQFFLGNYYNLSPQMNNLFNKNAPFSYTDKTMTHPNRMDSNPEKVRGGRFLIGFNITRLWNY